MIIEVSIRPELPLLDAIESDQVRNPVSACVPLRVLHQHSRGVAAVCGRETVFVVQVCAGTLWKSCFSESATTVKVIPVQLQGQLNSVHTRLFFRQLRSVRGW